ncbi:C40 family peptidase [Ligilactobacillus agilis]|uniref:C40 family peptidase n=1 Tax=Ligilactobacillus agilis TaxID=1601 RepID=UPI00255C4A40|nr:C40 family peptidase [Ligilactobacillus agilis]
MKKLGLKKVAVMAAAAFTVLGVATSASADTQSDLDAVKAKIAETEKKVSEGQVALSKLESQEAKTSQEISTLKKNIAARSEQLADQARAAQLNDAGSMLEFVANSDSVTEAVSRTVTVATVVRANNQTLADQKADKEKLAQKQTELQAAAEKQKEQNKELAQARADLAVQKTDLEAKKASEDEAKAKAEAAKKAAEEAAKQVAAAKSTDDAEKAANQAEAAAASVSSSSNNANNNSNSNNQAASQTTSQASSQAASTSAAPAASSVNSSSVLAMADSLTKMHIPYVWGGSSLSGFDCSGLTQYVYGHFGKSLARTAAAQAAQTTRIPVSQAQPGDLLFWGEGGGVYHVAIYVGGGSYIHAPTEGQFVKYGSISGWAPSFAGRL